MVQESSQKEIHPELPASVQVLESFEGFFKKVVRGSYPLFFSALAALIWANISAASYHDFWETHFTLSLGPRQMSKPLHHWIDEALMSIFFFTVGLEIIGIISGSIISAVLGLIVLGFWGSVQNKPT